VVKRVQQECTTTKSQKIHPRPKNHIQFLGKQGSKKKGGNNGGGGKWFKSLSVKEELPTCHPENGKVYQKGTLKKTLQGETSRNGQIRVGHVEREKEDQQEKARGEKEREDRSEGKRKKGVVRDFKI